LLQNYKKRGEFQRRHLICSFYQRSKIFNCFALQFSFPQVLEATVLHETETTLSTDP
jgi:hypothetical protein